MARPPKWAVTVQTKSGPRYEVRTHAKRPDGTRYQQKRRFKTLAAAVEWHTLVMSELRSGGENLSAPLTVKQAVEDWLSGQRIRDTTMAAYVASLRPIVDMLGDRAISSITKNDIESVVQALRTGASVSGAWNGPKKLKGKQVRSRWEATSVNPMLARMRSIMSDLVDQGVLSRNPASLVKSLRPVRSTIIQTLSAEQIPILLRDTETHPFGIAWRLAFLGLRRSEILALTWDTIDFQKNVLYIATARLAVAGGSRIGPTKTLHSTRVLPMPTDLLWALLRLQGRQAQTQEALGDLWPNSNMIVLDASGKPPHPRTLTKEWKVALRAANLPLIRLHDARHSCATLMHLNGIPAVVIAAWLGHADPGFTLRTYTHSNSAALSAAAQYLDTVTQEVAPTKPDAVA
ncbi:tyrosine-type recombinase/integrase [Mycobacteroides abscessus]|uniref:tyrosine-type recombinase/integrase n=1 Tax=Mycobacteroides abscessus TaxID=36809 RepID=UPI000940F84F|nr:site-specific integrase [Mycobacteroides abscessus]QSM41550.1 site-specific integrase [Mycobacteroides abscessus subsp. abscessus]